MSKLVGNGGNNMELGLCFFESSRAEKVATQDGMLAGIITLEQFGYGIRNGGFAGASMTGQPKDTRAGQ